jgi:spermidine synthase
VLTLARSVSERGELVLLRRADGALELRVNGAFAMDTAETTSERILATASLDAISAARPPLSSGPGALRVLVGGLGLGFTVAALLDDPRVDDVVVAEIEPDLVRWHRTGVIPRPSRNGAGRAESSLVDDPRVEVDVGDVRTFVDSQTESSFDLVLLDVDNGPGFLLYDANAAIYGSDFLRACAALLRPDGVTAIWSASESADLDSAMQTVFAATERQDIPVVLSRRHTEYHLYLGRTTATAREDG